MVFLPNRPFWEIKYWLLRSKYNYLIVTAIIGIFLPILFRKKKQIINAVNLISYFTISGSLALHFFTIIILQKDPHRALGYVPLPFGLGAVADFLSLFLFLPGYLFQGAMLSRIVRIKITAPKTYLNLFWIIFATYSAWIVQWCFLIIAD